MKYFTLFIFTFLTLSISAQDKLTGRYRDYFGSRIQLNSDSTFKYTWNFDMQSSWTKGVWKIKGDTIFFKIIPVYDTISQTLSNNIITDSLVLSQDEIPERIKSPTITATPVTLNQVAIQFPNIYSGNPSYLLSSGGQNKRYYLNKLIVKKGRLYSIINGKPFSKKVKGIWTNKKFPTWYFKSNE